MGYMAKKRGGWYPLNPVGRVLTATYVCIPAYVAVAQTLGVYPAVLNAPLLGGMSLILVCAAVSRRKKIQLFRARPHGGGGFTLVELLVVISILGILATLVLPLITSARKAAYTARAKTELRNIGVAVERYAIDNGNYPADTSRNLPPGLEAYLGGGNWPLAPWPGSVYDWDNWTPAQLQYNPKTDTRQISIRFCSTPGTCTFPNEPWAENFDYYSSVYYCISGSCRAHADMPMSHPSYCINC